MVELEFSAYPDWQRARLAARLARPPRPAARDNALFSLVIDACAPASAPAIAATLVSLNAQSYRNIELFLVGAAGASSAIDPAWLALAQSLRGLSKLPVSADRLLDDPACDALWRGDMIGFVPAGTLFDPDAFALIHAALDARRPVSELPGLILTDWDAIDAFGGLCRPRFLPGWDPDLNRAVDYIGPGFLAARGLIDAVRRLGRPALSPSNWLALASEPGLPVDPLHVAEPVMHVPAAADPGLAARPRPDAPSRSPGEKPRVAVIIPNRDRPDLLRRALGFLDFDNGFEPELIIVDNASTDPQLLSFYDRLIAEHGARIVVMAQSFNFSRMINLGAAAASAPVLVLMNNDVEIPAPGLLEQLVCAALRPEVGAVGSKLLNADGTVQHAGILLGGRLTNGHVMRRAPGDAGGYLGILSTPRNYQAVTGALMATRRDVFERSGGMDEIHLPVAYNDVDYCLKQRAAGLRVLCLPLDGIVHRESSTRGADAGPAALGQSATELHCMRQRWPEAFRRDPFANPNVMVAEVPAAKLAGDRR